jgi:hypothetical protein
VVLPERLRPRELAVLDHAFVAGPDIVDQHIDAVGFRQNPAKGRFDLVVDRMIAAGGRAAALHVTEVLLESTADVHHRAGIGQLARDAPSDASAGAGHDGHFAPQHLHGVTVRRWSRACIGKMEPRVCVRPDKCQVNTRFAGVCGTCDHERRRRTAGYGWRADIGRSGMRDDGRRSQGSTGEGWS